MVINYAKNSAKQKGGGVMSMCKVCHRDSKKHSEKTWMLHQQKERCTFCGENREKHSEKLWNIHEETVPKNAKLVVSDIAEKKKIPCYLVDTKSLSKFRSADYGASMF